MMKVKQVAMQILPSMKNDMEVQQVAMQNLTSMTVDEKVQQVAEELLKLAKSYASIKSLLKGDYFPPKWDPKVAADIDAGLNDILDICGVSNTPRVDYRGGMKRLFREIVPDTSDSAENVALTMMHVNELVDEDVVNMTSIDFLVRQVSECTSFHFEFDADLFSSDEDTGPDGEWLFHRP